MRDSVLTKQFSTILATSRWKIVIKLRTSRSGLRIDVGQRPLIAGERPSAHIRRIDETVESIFATDKRVRNDWPTTVTRVETVSVPLHHGREELTTPWPTLARRTSTDNAVDLCVRSDTLGSISVRSAIASVRPNCPVDGGAVILSFFVRLTITYYAWSPLKDTPPPHYERRRSFLGIINRRPSYRNDGEFSPLKTFEFFGYFSRNAASGKKNPTVVVVVTVDSPLARIYLIRRRRGNKD